MKVVLFCGGLGMRMREYSESIPKPMVPIGLRPVLWHLMKFYAHYGHADFVLCLGYRGDLIKDYFLNYKEWLTNDLVMEAGGRHIEILSRDIDQWRITFVDTGITANVGERLRAVRPHLEGEESFLANYADGLSDIDLPKLLAHHEHEGKIATFVAVPPSSSMHLVDLEGDGTVTSIGPMSTSGALVNGGYFVLRQEIFDYLGPGEELVVEPFQRLIAQQQLTSYRHEGFWVGMDTFKDRQLLDDLWQRGEAPWEVWRSPISLS